MMLAVILVIVVGTLRLIGSMRIPSSPTRPVHCSKKGEWPAEEYRKHGTRLRSVEPRFLLRPELRCGMHLLAKSLLRETPSIICVEFLDAVLGDYPKRDFQVRFWDDTIWGTEKQPRFTLVLKHPGALRAMFSSPSELSLGEAYIHDDFDIEGDIEAAFDLSDYLLSQERSLWESFDLHERLQKLPKSDRPASRPAPH